MPDVAPDSAARGRDASTPDGTADRTDEPERDPEADRISELANRLDPVPDEVTEAARGAWRARFTPRRRERPPR